MSGVIEVDRVEFAELEQAYSEEIYLYGRPVHADGTPPIWAVVKPLMGFPILGARWDVTSDCVVSAFQLVVPSSGEVTRQLPLWNALNVRSGDIIQVNYEFRVCVEGSPPIPRREGCPG